MLRTARLSPLFAGLAGVILLGAADAVEGQPATAAASKLQPLDVIYVPTPDTVVAKMLSMAKVGPGDVVFDLGSGDGRIVIAAVRDFGAARGVGYELDPVRNNEARANANAAGVTDKVQFIAEDLFQADLSGATVITTYLLPILNERLVPTFRRLKPGTRIVTHNYDLTADWKPVEKVVIDGHIVYSFVVPKR